MKSKILLLIMAVSFLLYFAQGAAVLPTTVSFGGPTTQAEPDEWLGIDNVRVSIDSTLVPEPATMLLLGSGLVGLAGFRRKFKRQEIIVLLNVGIANVANIHSYTLQVRTTPLKKFDRSGKGFDRSV